MTGITLDRTELEMTVGDAETLVPTVAPENATDKTVRWESSDYDVATVGKSGRVTALGAGTAMIAAECGGFRATCVVTVKEKTEEDQQ